MTGPIDKGPSSMKSVLQAAALGAAIALTSACASATYAALEQFGVEKRDILVDRVDDARDAQEDASVEFKDALEAFRAMVDVDGGDLEKLYDRLDREYASSENAAKDVRTRIRDVNRVANDLFREWRRELDEYSDDSLRRISAERLEETEERYETLITRMRAASDSMDPVLAVFRDRVLFLKHNLNASAIASLDREKARIEGDVSELIAEMEASIAAADAFIAEMRGTG